jgi:SAM-dependent methyltransferase
MSGCTGPTDAACWPEGSLETLGHCPICGRSERVLLHDALTDRLFFSSPGYWTLFSCKACRAAYLDPRPTTGAIHLAYRNYYTHFDRPDDDPAEPGTGGIASLKQTILRQYIRMKFGPNPEPLRNPLCLAMFLRPRVRVAFDGAMRHLEVDPIAAAHARARGFEVHLGEAKDLLHSELKFEAVTMSHVIEHVHEPLALLQTARNLLCPGGFFWIETPNIESHGHNCFGEYWRGLEPPRHLQLFHHGLLQEALTGAGFVDVQLAPWQANWGATFQSSCELAAGAGVFDCGDTTAIKEGETVGRDEPLRREFITLTARASATQGATVSRRS